MSIEKNEEMVLEALYKPVQTQGDINFVDTLNARFKYKEDRDQFGYRDAWYVMTGEPYYGDCEDYSLTILFNLKGRSWTRLFISLLIRESKICYCKIGSGEGHAVLRYKNHYIDNIQKKWCTRRYLESRGCGYVFSDWMYIPYQVVYKLLMGVIQKRRKT